MKKQKILVTGANGLVGTRLLPRLVAAGFECIALIRGDKKLPEGVTAIKGDLLNFDTLSETVKDICAVVHLAAVFRSPDDDLIWNSNLDGTKNLIKAIKIAAPRARFIFSSTSNVYNKNSSHPGNENDTVEPILAYPASKIAAENALKKSGLNWSILRFPFVYGDGDEHLVDLARHVVAAKFHPAMRMSIIHHIDIFNAIKMALNGFMDSKTVNIADEAPTTIYELMQLIGKPIQPSSEPLIDPWHLHINVSLARSLGFQPEIRTIYQAVKEDII